MADIVQFAPQTGDAVQVGFDGHTQTGFIMQVVSGPNPEADVSEITAQDASTYSVLVADEKHTLELEGVLTTAGLSTMEGKEIGDTITVNTVAYRITSLAINRGPKQTSCRLGLIKEDSITYS
jgi:hypothetical protein